MGYWLLKSEPECYSIDDLERAGVDIWDGCRNYTVRNFFRDSMQPGDLGFFYHSGETPPGIVGVLSIVGQAYPDPTQFDPKSPQFDPKSLPDAPRWLARDVRFERRFARKITLPEIKAHPVLCGMEVAKNFQRLSVMPVTEQEWHTVLALADT